MLVEPIIRLSYETLAREYYPQPTPLYAVHGCNLRLSSFELDLLGVAMLLQVHYLEERPLVT
jgi:hypothetical protein